jgi:MFS family permease
VFLGLYVRLTITETPVFRAALSRGEQLKVPILAVFRKHTRALVAGVLVSLATFVLFYLMTVFALSWGTSALGYSRGKFLLMQLFCVSFFALTIPISAVLAERGRRRVMLWITVFIGIFGLIMAPMFVAGTTGAVLMMTLGLALMGLTYGPLGTLISELFPTPVRYTGSSLAFSLAGILGASLAPYIATWLATNLGLQYVGYYLSASAVLTLLGLLSIRETKDDDLTTEQSHEHAPGIADSLATESTGSPRRRTAVL